MARHHRNDKGWTTLDGHALVEMTPGELRAVFSALDSYLMAGTEEECRVIFGSAASTRAAFRIREKIVAAGVEMKAIK